MHAMPDAAFLGHIKYLKKNAYAYAFLLLMLMLMLMLMLNYA